jgi:type II secretory pathway pseudopilin PulG
MKNRSQQAGFTITEVLVVVGMIGGGLLGIFSLQTNSMKNQNLALNNMEVADLRYEISGLVAREEQCGKFLGGKTSDESGFIFSEGIQAGAIYGKLKITTVKFSDIRDLGNDKRAANIQVTGTKLGGNPAQAAFDEKIPVYYTVSAANVVMTCRDNSSVCIAMGGLWKVDHCDFCANLGGVLQANNTCAMTP